MYVLIIYYYFSKWNRLVFENRYIDFFLYNFWFPSPFSKKTIWSTRRERYLQYYIKKSRISLIFSSKVLHLQRTFSFQYFLTSIINNNKLIHEKLWINSHCTRPICHLHVCNILSKIDISYLTYCCTRTNIYIMMCSNFEIPISRKLIL